MRTLADFAGPGHPLRASSIPLLMKCPMTAALRFLEDGDSSGVAADTGSAVHKAVHAWHTNDQDYGAALAAMREGVAAYPLADFHDAELHFRPYCADPRNQGANLVAAETRVEFEAEKGVHVRGTFDQVRRTPDGRLTLHDLKTGQAEGWDMRGAYLYQIAAYCVGATQALGEPVHPGSIIRTRGYRKRAKLPVDPPGVFWGYTQTLDDCRRLMAAVARKVAEVRAGRLSVVPGDHCRYCPARDIDTCVPKLLQIGVPT